MNGAWEGWSAKKVAAALFLVAVAGYWTYALFNYASVARTRTRPMSEAELERALEDEAARNAAFVRGED